MSMAFRCRVVVILLTMGSGLLGCGVRWQHFESSQGFSVAIPAEGQEWSESARVGGRPEQLYLLQATTEGLFREQGVCMVGTIHLTDRAAPTQVEAEVEALVVERLAIKGQATVSDRRTVTRGGRAGVEFLVTVFKGLEYHVRIMVLDRRAYFLVAGNEFAEEDHRNRLYDSFRLRADDAQGAR